MGWTAYWKRPTELPATEFAAATRDCAKLLADLDVRLAGRDGTGKLIVSNESIVFNGAEGQSCEPFEIAQVEFDRRGRPDVRSFCKTERLPYTLAVQVCLIVLRHHLGDRLQVVSDGGPEEWDDARERVVKSLGYGRDFRLDAPDHA